MAKYCCVCKRPLDSEDAPILAFGAYGSPKCLCRDCSNYVEKATESMDYDEILSASKNLQDAMIKGDTGDIAIIEKVNEILSSSKEKAEAIKAGTYDFSADTEDEEEFDITEDLEETEEDRARDEKDAKTMKIIDTVLSWVSGVVLLAAVIFFILKFVI